MNNRTLFLSLLFIAPAVSSQEAPKINFAPKSYICCRTAQPLTIDGVLNEENWQKAAWTDAFVDIEGELKPLPRYATRAKMLWDDAFLYIAAQMEEPQVWATLRDHDSIIFYDNDFEVFIDPDGDTHRYFELEVNAFATAWDLFLDRPYRDDGRPLFFWDIRGLQKAVAVQGSINQTADTDSGWTLELAIPWSVLKEQALGGRAPGAGEQWRINFSRVEWRVEVENGHYVKVKDPATGRPLPEDNWVWSPQGLVNMHYPEMWGFVLFSSELPGAAAAAFVLPGTESIKWLLRQVYYRQRALHQEKGSYASSWKTLNLKLQAPAGYLWPPRLYGGPGFFEAVLTAADRSSSWHIRQDGLVWRTPKLP